MSHQISRNLKIANSISRARIEDLCTELITALGVDVEDVHAIGIKSNHVEMEVYAHDEQGAVLVDDTMTALMHRVCIPIVDDQDQKEIN